VLKQRLSWHKLNLPCNPPHGEDKTGSSVVKKIKMGLELTACNFWSSKRLVG
jgi:hypothetical protein